MLAGGAPFSLFKKETAEARAISVSVGQDIERRTRLLRILGVIERCQARAADEVISMDAWESSFGCRIEEPGTVALKASDAERAA